MKAGKIIRQFHAPGADTIFRYPRWDDLDDDRDGSGWIPGKNAT